ncbi:MAG: NAD(P)/FAD-dependent oxidoreductase, partial [Candidatus Sericytochromatia bacterium]
MDKTRIVILGGGFGGVYTALHLEKRFEADPTVEIVLVSRDNYFLMTPLLFEAGSGVLEPRHAVNPIRPLLGSTRFIEAEVDQIDFEGRVIYGSHTPSHAGDLIEYELPYDQLVLALGGVTNRRLIPGSERALAFKTLSDAIHVRNHIIDLFEQADVTRDPARQCELMTFVVIGGGLVGVELMGELTEFVSTLLKTYRHVDPSKVRFHLLEAGPKVLAEMDRDLAGYAMETLAHRGVDIRVGVPVTAIEAHAVRLGDETIRSRTIVLAAGVAANPLLADFPLQQDRKGRLVVDATMRSVDRPEVWALGDCAAIPDPEGNSYPPLAQHALREAKVLAANIESAMNGGELAPFLYESKGTLASLGHFSGVGKLSPSPRFPIKITGFVAWWVWRTYYMMQMPKLERRIRLIIDWTVALFFKNDVAKLDLYVDPQPAAL